MTILELTLTGAAVLGAFMAILLTIIWDDESGKPAVRPRKGIK